MWLDKLIELVGEEKVIVSDNLRERLSKDYYWYSPVLFEELKDKVADCVVKPTSIEEIQRLVTFAVENKVPVTIRGAGTGNYGQAIPLKGGIVLDLTKMDKLLDLKEDTVKVQAGMRLGTLEKKLRKQGKELRIYPSTFMTATVGGFLCGGSGGIGSIRWGNLWDGNILGVTVMTFEGEPRIFEVVGEEIEDYIHNYGTTGIVLEAILPVEEKQEWTQHIISFPTFKEAVKFGDELAHKEEIIKRLVSVCEWPIPSHFHSLKDVLHEEKSITMLEIEESCLDALQSLVDKYKGSTDLMIPANNYHKGLKVSDFTWNHATLWAHKHGENMTYLQARFKVDRIFEQMDTLRAEFGEEIQFHFEYIKIKGKITPASLPVILYQSKERLYEIIDFCRTIEVEINDPHTYLLGFGGYNLKMEKILMKKRENDPFDLLNPGKIPVKQESEII
ncbi:FAD linked oxidase domain-containing protein [Niallia circulans]|uniref:FAD-binding oxidoreductase n=1 Tax=Niallia circulans TaxID=1397 RepID=UPI00077CD9DD|nr:FAD-binding oxidoreductase [Niallia circulans]MDR4317619.1 FAD-binding oxidoreductase [Niallia circulans]MED3841070.1 FAD-binding oxidoreductase [Niallia circulans]MED4245433.1 FAD-binding oxidoreductase [Niallia circulans]MED4249318.1 FAD-binding oxidoreductase [Niallia circulans]QKH63295.1 FAD-binding oxidoreductase [Niallia circulans]